MKAALTVLKTATEHGRQHERVLSMVYRSRFR